MKIIKQNDPPTKQIECCNCRSELEILFSDLVYQPKMEISQNVIQLEGFYVTCPVCKCKNHVTWFKPIITHPHDPA